MKIAEDITKPIWQQPGFDPSTFLYQRKCVLSYFYDADTPYVYLDKGSGEWECGHWQPSKQRFKGVPLRLARINAWEIRGEERSLGLLAKAYVEELINPFDEFRIFTYKDRGGKYGRLLCDVAIAINGKTECLNDLIVANGHGSYRQY